MGGGRIDFALYFGAVGLGATLSLQVPALSLLVFIAGGCAACSEPLRSATRSWLHTVGRAWTARRGVAAMNRYQRDAENLAVIYRGLRAQVGVTSDGAPVLGTIVVREAGNVVSQLQPRWPTGFDWGNLSGGAADLAWILLGEGVAPEVYEGFARAVVAELPERWRLAAEEIELFARCWPISSTARMRPADADRQRNVFRNSDSGLSESVSA